MHRAKLSLLALTAILVTSLPTYAQQTPSPDQTTPAQKTTEEQSQPTVDLIGVGTTLLNTLINPPSRSAEIAADAEVRKAKIAADAEIAKEKLRLEANKTADKVTPLLNQWGVSRVSCAPGLVFINGITIDTVCIQPNASMTAGYYTYDSNQQKLLRNSSNHNVANTNTTTNVRSVRTVQSTKISTPGQGF